jgi:hypothetical protein
VEFVGRIVGMNKYAIIPTDFGEEIIYHEGVELSRCYMAPGLTIDDLNNIYDNNYVEGNEFASDPSEWPSNKALIAVVDAVVKAIMDTDINKENKNG